MTSDSPFPPIADDLLTTIDEALPRLRAVSNEIAMQPVGPEKWTIKEVIGHLIDSATNNHQRFVRAQHGPLVFPAYMQDHWVTSQRYHDREWSDLIDLWSAYNRHIAHVIRQIPADRRDTRCTIGSNEPVTLEFLARDYVDHLRHHLLQVGA